MRAVVARYSGCLSRLTVRQRRVLRLRAGVGPAEPASRAHVARRLDLSLRKVRVAERRGLRALRRAAADGCSAATAGEIADGAALAPAGGSDGGDTLLASESGLVEPEREASSTRAATRSDGDGFAPDGRGAVKGNSSAGPPAVRLPRASSHTLLTAIGLGVFVMWFLVAGWLQMKRLREAPTHDLG